MDQAEVKKLRVAFAALKPTNLDQIRADFAAGSFTGDLARLEPKRAEVGAALDFLAEITDAWFTSLGL